MDEPPFWYLSSEGTLRTLFNKEKVCIYCKLYTQMIYKWFSIVQSIL